VSTPATIRVVSTDPASQGPFVTLNAADFDPAVHQPFDADADAPAETDIAPAKPRGRSPKTHTA
jgi:hypothetical protein